MTDSLKLRTLSGWSVLAVGALLFISSFTPAILRGGNEPVSGIIALVGLLAIVAGISFAVATTQGLTERQARYLGLVSESLLLSAAGGTLGILVEGGSFFASLGVLHTTLVVLFIALFCFAVLARISVAQQSSSAFVAHSDSLFTIGGRIGRLEFWLAGIIVSVANTIALVIISAEGKGGEGGASLAFTLFFMWLPFGLRAGLAYQIKRWHDRGKSGWMVLVGFIPIVGSIWILVELGFLRGTGSSNRFGADPLQAKLQTDAQTAV